MKVAKSRAPAGIVISLVTLTCLAVPLTGCRFFRKSASTTKSSSVDPRRKEIQISNDRGMALQDTLDAGNYVLSFAFTNSSFVSGLADVDISISVNDSSVFESTQFSVPMGITIRHADGSAETKMAAQPILSDKLGLNARGVFKVRAGDVLDIVVNDVPDALRSGKIYAYVSPLAVKSQSEVGALAAVSSTWDAEKMVLASAPAESMRNDVKVGAKGLYTFDTFATTYKPSASLVGRVDGVAPCFWEPGVTGSGSVSSTRDTKPWSVPLEKPEGRKKGQRTTGTVRAECRSFSGFVTVEADAAPAAFETMVSGLTPGEAFIAMRQNGSGEGKFVGAKLGTVIAPLGNPTENFRADNIGRYEKQKVSFVVKGVKNAAGLKLKLSSNFVMPMNIPEVAASTFDGTGMVATLRHASGPKTGQAVTDSQGAPLEVFKIADLGQTSKHYVSFDDAHVPDPSDGDYEVTLDFPADFPTGAYVDATLVASGIVDRMEPLDPAVIADFRARDAATGAVVHDWPEADYSAPDNPPKRERIAMVAVAKAMEDIRDAMHLVMNGANPWTGVKSLPSGLNTVALGAPVSCLGSNPAPHWSDLTLHYYCQLNEARTCYTGGIRAIAGYMQKVQAEETEKGGGEAAIKGAIACRLPSMKKGPVTLPVLTFDPNYKYPTLRQYVFSQCAIDPKAALSSIGASASAIPGCLARNDVQAYAPSEKDRINFSWITKDPERAKVFRYIMDAPTFAFDEKDQQDLINAFYRASKPSDCSKRPRRAIDKEPAAGRPSVCEVGHDQDPPRAAANR